VRLAERANCTEFNLYGIGLFHHRTHLTGARVTHWLGEWRWELARVARRTFRAKPRYWHPLRLAIVAAFVLLGTECVTPVDTLTSAPTLDYAQSCPRLESQLYQLSRSTDHGRFALGAGLDLNTSGVRVVIELVTGAHLPQKHGMRVESSYANSVQVRVPVSELCALARDPAVISVLVPNRGLPETGR
jgi:hypothetical protein